MRKVDAYRNWAVALLAMSVSGCTAVGFGLGAIADSASKDKSRMFVAHAHRGEKLTLHMRDGTRIRCKMLWLEQPDSASYAARYEAWHRSDPGSQLVPRPGERVKLSGGTRAYEGGFQGLAPAGVRIASAGTAPATTVPFEAFQTLVDEQGRVSSSELLKEHVVLGRVPTGTTVAFTRLTDSGGTPGGSNGAATESVAWDDVMRVDGPAGRQWKTTGTVVGLVTDILLLVAAAAYGASGSF